VLRARCSRRAQLSTKVGAARAWLAEDLLATEPSPAHGGPGAPVGVNVGPLRARLPTADESLFEGPELEPSWLAISETIN
jgi:hypothetical protein